MPVSHQQLAQTVGEQLLRALEDKETELDDEIKQLNTTDLDELDRIREKRLREIKKEACQLDNLRRLGHGTYNEIEEKEFFEVAKNSYYMVAHFSRPTTRRCEIVDFHLTNLALKHIRTRFVKLNAEKSHFLADRLQITVIPTILIVVNQKTEHMIIGFDEFGGHDNFSTLTVENVLKNFQVIGKPIPEAPINTD